MAKGDQLLFWLLKALRYEDFVWILGALYTSQKHNLRQASLMEIIFRLSKGAFFHLKLTLVDSLFSPQFGRGASSSFIRASG